jgi:ABC-type nitrate/sulfonate/bicarbonate transport system permease component
VREDRGVSSEGDSTDVTAIRSKMRAPVPADVSGSTPARTGQGRTEGPFLLRSWQNLWPLLLGIGVLLLAWQLVVVVTGLRPAVLPPPAQVWRNGWADRSVLLSNTWPTLEETLVGLGFAILSAWLLALIIDSFAIGRRTFYPLLVASQSIPILVIAPLFVIWFGFGLVPKILIVVLVTFFPTMVGLLEGFASCEKDAMRLLRSMGANRWQLLSKLRLPNAMPYFFTGLRVSVTYGVVAAIFGEYVGGYSGLGIYMQVEKNSFRTDLVLAAVIVTALLSVLLYGSTYLIQRIVTPWYRRSTVSSNASE